MSLAPGERRVCASCGTEFVGARNLADPRRPGAKHAREGVVPITLAPNAEKGNVLLQMIDGEVRCIIFGKVEVVTYLRECGVQLRVSHFADCNDPDRFRRPTQQEGA